MLPSILSKNAYNSIVFFSRWNFKALNSELFSEAVALHWCGQITGFCSLYGLFD
jgi:hypothetical protein